MKLEETTPPIDRLFTIEVSKEELEILKDAVDSALNKVTLQKSYNLLSEFSTQIDLLL